jgi:Protein of unknown function (DUF2586)
VKNEKCIITFHSSLFTKKDMALTNVNFQITEDGLGRIADNEDNISALLFSGSAPSSFGTDKIRAYTNIDAVEADGIQDIDALYSEAHYHISEFFRISSGALLYVCFGLTDIAEELYNVSGGKIRQYGTIITNLAHVQTVHQAVATTLAGRYAPLNIVVGYEPTATPAIGDLDDLALKTAPYVSVIAFGDDNGRGKTLATALGKPYMSAMGMTLGLISKARVQESIGALNRFNMTDGTEFVKVENGVLKPAIKYVTGQTYSDGITLQLDNKRYLSPRFYAGNAGIYIEKDHTAYSPTKDLSVIRNGRTINKAVRGVREKLLPRLKSNVSVDDKGNLEPDFVEFLKSLASQNLNQMQRDGEISRFGVSIEPNQNVLASDRIDIEIRLIPIGVANFINVRMGFTRSLAGFQ